MNILVTGGLGYIGSHTVVEMLNSGYKVFIVDNLSNSSIDVLDKIEKITNKRPDFKTVDLLDYQKLEEVFVDNDFDGVIHFAGLKAVGESVEQPLIYYDNNVVATVNLLKIMEKHGVDKIIFSSSATVYGESDAVPFTEDDPIYATNPYGQSKIIVENILSDYAQANKNFTSISLRYFNPVGAHKSGLIGENPQGIPNNLVPYIAQVAVGNQDHLRVWGNDYKTLDGTGVRDYIHVVDLAKGHLKALKYSLNNKGVEIINLGTGKGYSVLEVLKAFEKASGRNIPYKFYPRRAGDIATSYANVDKAFKLLAWETKSDIDEMCIDFWRFISKKSLI